MKLEKFKSKLEEINKDTSFMDTEVYHMFQSLRMLTIKKIGKNK